MRFSSLLIVTLITLVTSCVFPPQYDITYSFVPPQDSRGRECANQCIIEKNSCIRYCRKDPYKERGDKSKGSKTIIVVNTGQNSDQNLNPVPQDNASKLTNYDPSQCINECNESHRLCHQNCGGKIITNKKCVAFCDSEKNNTVKP